MRLSSRNGFCYFSGGLKISRCRVVWSNGFLRCRYCGQQLGAGGRVPECRMSAEIFLDKKRPDFKLLQTDCVLRGEFLRLENCKPCQSGGATPRVFVCGLHGECVLHSIAKRKGDGSAWAACSICPDRLSPKNGNGRNGADDENQRDSAG